MQFPDRVYVYMCERCKKSSHRSFINHVDIYAPGENLCGGDVYRQAYQVMNADPVKL